MPLMKKLSKVQEVLPNHPNFWVCDLETDWRLNTKNSVTVLFGTVELVKRKGRGISSWYCIPIVG